LSLLVDDLFFVKPQHKVQSLVDTRQCSRQARTSWRSMHNYQHANNIISYVLYDNTETCIFITLLVRLFVSQLDYSESYDPIFMKFSSLLQLLTRSCCCCCRHSLIVIAQHIHTRTYELHKVSVTDTQRQKTQQINTATCSGK